MEVFKPVLYFRTGGLNGQTSSRKFPSEIVLQVVEVSDSFPLQISELPTGQIGFVLNVSDKEGLLLFPFLSDIKGTFDSKDKALTTFCLRAVISMALVLRASSALLICSACRTFNCPSSSVTDRTLDSMFLMSSDVLISSWRTRLVMSSWASSLAWLWR